ncbi:MAG: ClbS/DfsB family four-helix bundle protein [Chloroflexi bacterium]|nr:ClbS/DfsB family four-helix bundle protein [Chloroflexota bacterium]
MNKHEFLQTLRAEREALEALLAQVGEARMSQPGVEGDWSAKDIVAHLRFWEQSVVDELERLARGENPQPNPDVNTDETNAQVFAANHNRLPADVLSESRQTFQRLLIHVEGLPEVDLFDPQRHPWIGDNDPLWKEIEMESYGHYRQHLPALRAWLVQNS